MHLALLALAATTFADVVTTILAKRAGATERVWLYRLAGPAWVGVRIGVSVGVGIAAGVLAGDARYVGHAWAWWIVLAWCAVVAIVAVRNWHNFAVLRGGAA